MEVHAQKIRRTIIANSGIPDNVLDHLQKGLVPVALEKGVICGDGGYGETVLLAGRNDTKNVVGAPGMLGEHLGIVMAIVGAYNDEGKKPDVEEITKSVFSLLIPACYHTSLHELHSHEKHPHFDCGHILRMTLPQNFEAYGVCEDQAEKAIKAARTMREKFPATVHEHVLDREHHEAGVLAIMGRAITCIHKLGEDETESQFFVVNPDIEKDIITEAGHKLAYNPDFVDRIYQAKIRQNAVTLGLLAKSLPFYEIVENSDGITVRKVGTVTETGSITA